MTLLVSDVLDMAEQRSPLNNKDLVNTVVATKYLNNYQRGIYLLAAKENPEYFGTDSLTAARVAETDPWDISNVLLASIQKVEVNAVQGAPAFGIGTEVNLVPFLEQNNALSPRVYVRGRKIRDVGSELSDSATDFVTRLKLFHSPLPAALVDETSVLTLPDEWVDLLVLPLARIYAVREERDSEVRELTQEWVQLRADFVESIKVYDAQAVKTPGAVSPVNLYRTPSGGTGG